MWKLAPFGKKYQNSGIRDHHMNSEIDSFFVKCKWIEAATRVGEKISLVGMAIADETRREEWLETCTPPSGQKTGAE